MQPQVLMKERTNFVHNIHIVHVVPLPQVEGQLLGQEKESRFHLFHSVIFLYYYTQFIILYFLLTFKNNPSSSAVWLKVTGAVELQCICNGEPSTHPSVSTGLFEHPVGKIEKNILLKNCLYL